jgi:hypothetical protein
MKITRSNTFSTRRGPVDYFTGNVLLDEVTAAPYSSDVRGPGDLVRTGRTPLARGRTTPGYGPSRVQRVDDSGSAATWQVHVTDAEYSDFIAGS